MDDTTDHSDDALKRASTGTPNEFGGSLLDDDFTTQVTSLVSQEPRTTTEVHQSLGEPQGLTREQTRYRLDKLSESGSIQSKKPPGRTASKIFWGDDIG